MATIVIPLPDSDFDVTEVAVPWKVFSRAGHRVVFATERGTVAACDPLLLRGVLFGQLGATSEPKDFYAEMARSTEFRAPQSWTELRAKDFDCCVLPGGHAPGMRHYLESQVLMQLVAEFWGLRRPLGAICHGTVLLARTRDQANGNSVLHGMKTTALPKYMERSAYLATFWKLGRYYRTYPEYVEDEVTRNLASPADFARGPRVLSRRGTETDDRAAFVVEDGHYVSARWPGDAYLFSKKLLARLPPS